MAGSFSHKYGTAKPGNFIHILSGPFHDRVFLLGFCPEFVKRALRDRPQIKTSQISVGMLPRQLNVEENSESPENSGMYACKSEFKAPNESPMVSG